MITQLEGGGRKSGLFLSMKYTLFIDQQTSIDWGLNIQQAALYDFLYSLPSWADRATIDGEPYYFAAKTMIVKELPLLTDKPDTVYRHMKSLQELGLIDIQKIGNRDYIRLSEKAKEWNRSTSEHSEKNPTNLGKKSEINSEKFPTDKLTILDHTTSDQSTLFPNEKNPQKKTLFRNSAAFDLEYIQKHLQKNEKFRTADSEHYFNAVARWNEINTTKRTARGWVATIEQWITSDIQKNQLVREGTGDNRLLRSAAVFLGTNT